MINNFQIKEVYSDVNMIPKSYNFINQSLVNNKIQFYEKKLSLFERIQIYLSCFFVIPLFFEEFRKRLDSAWYFKKITIEVTITSSIQKINNIAEKNKIKTKNLNPFDDIVQAAKILEIPVLKNGEEITFNKLVEYSHNFTKNMGLKKSPTEANNLERIAKTSEDQKKVIEFAKATRPLLAPKVITLIEDYLAFKQENGTEAEKRIYQGCSWDQFVERLLSKRPIVFYGQTDVCLFRGMQQTKQTAGTDLDFKNIKFNEEALEEYLSYDEMQIGALLTVAGPNFFISKGSKKDVYQLGKDPFEKELIVAGTVGCRFEREEVMEYQHMMIAPLQNTKEKGFGAGTKDSQFAFWNKFYGVDHFPTYEEVKALEASNKGEFEKRYFKIKSGVHQSCYLNVEVYKKRQALAFEPFLTDMNRRAKEQNNQAFVRLKGLGLGAWAINKKDPVIKEKQITLMIEAIYDILQRNQFENIDHVELTREDKNNSINEILIDKENGEGKHKIAISYNLDASPASELSHEQKGKLLGCNFPWDGAAFPGNEYWVGGLDWSGDPVMASASQIKDLHNIYVNPYLKENIKLLSLI